jgi:hypothetical protein
MLKQGQEPTYAIGDRTRSDLSDDLRGKQHLLVPSWSNISNHRTQIRFTNEQ